MGYRTFTPPSAEWASKVFWPKVEIRGESECWPWRAGGAVGYGHIRVATVLYLAHRVAYELAVGPLLPDHVVDHTCHNEAVDECVRGDRCPHRGCVNPRHLEAVSFTENVRRAGPAGAALAHSLKTHCKNGHLLPPPNMSLPSGQRRLCRPCHRASANAYTARQRAKAEVM